jgi:hypothetical protein
MKGGIREERKVGREGGRKKWSMERRTTGREEW